MRYLPNIFIKKREDSELNEKDLMYLEHKCFLSTLQMGWEDKEYLLNKSVSCFFAFDKERIIGEIYAVSDYDEEEPETDDDKHFFEIIERCKKEEGAYVYSIGVVPKYGGKDIGKRLLISLLMDLKDKGFKKIFAHAKKGASEHLFKFFDGKVLGYRENWYDTNTTYAIIELDLEPLILSNPQPYKQENGYDCGLACLETVLNYRGIKYDIKKVSADSGITKEGVRFSGIIQALSEFDTKIALLKDVDDLVFRISMGKVCIICVLSPGCYEGHYLIMTGIGEESLYCFDVSLALFGRMSYEELNRVWYNNITKSKLGVAI